MTPVRILGNPVRAAVVALALIDRAPGITLALDLGAVERSEGELMGLGRKPEHAPAWFTGLASAIWPGFQVRTAGGLATHAAGIALIDPMQCVMALHEADARLVAAEDYPDIAATEVRSSDRAVGAAQMLEASALPTLPLPVIYEFDAQAPDRFGQTLPFGNGLVMTRQREGKGQPSRLIDDLKGAGWLLPV